MLVPTVLIAWVLLAPFLAGAAVARSARIRAAYARTYPLGLVAGWMGLGLLAAGAHLLDGPAAIAALGAGGPLTGLSFWSLRIDDDDGEEGPGPADDPPPTGDGIDWDAFDSGFRDYVERAGRERVPAGRA